MNAVEPVPIPTQTLRRSAIERRAVVVVLGTIVAIAATLIATGASSPGTPVDPPLLARFDSEAAGVARTNHVLEETQVLLANARISGAATSTVTALERDVALLERDYAAAIASMAAASRTR